MTLVAAWIRRVTSHEQLIVASDSCLSMGARWNCVPKIFPLRRDDSVLAFCGNTFYAYPILLQLVNAINNYDKAVTRELDLTDLRTHFLKVIESMRNMVTDLPKSAHHSTLGALGCVSRVPMSRGRRRRRRQVTSPCRSSTAWTVLMAGHATSGQRCRSRSRSFGAPQAKQIQRNEGA
jgi:hypothetical protein